MPGTRKIDSTKNDPVPTAAKRGPNSVTTGISAFFSACLKMTGPSARPLARAVSVKSARMTSSMLARVKRAMIPIGASASVTVGSTRPRFVHERESKVAAHGLADEDRELLPQRLVEPVVCGEGLLALRRQWVGAFRHGIEGTARRSVHDEERHERHREQCRHQPEQPGHRVVEHLNPPEFR